MHTECHLDKDLGMLQKKELPADLLWRFRRPSLPEREESVARDQSLQYALAGALQSWLSDYETSVLPSPLGAGVWRYDLAFADSNDPVFRSGEGADRYTD